MENLKVGDIITINGASMVVKGINLNIINLDCDIHQLERYATVTGHVAEPTADGWAERVKYDTDATSALLACNRCGHTWPRRTASPKRCPKCGSPYWNQTRVRNNGAGQ